MNDSSFYEVVFLLSAAMFLALSIIICISVKHSGIDNIKRDAIMTVIALFFLGITISCYTNINNTYKEVYYLEYTVYYPGNICKFKVDSCNHVYTSSDRGTNHIRYYSIPKKDTYGTDTTAPIVINKIIKK